MRKLIIIIFIGISIPNIIHGQIGNWNFELNYFPSIGYRIISGEDKNLINHYHRIRMTNSFGINAYYNLTTNTSIGTGLNYDEYGMNAKIDEVFDGTKYVSKSKIKSKYVNVPVLFTVKTSKNGFFRFGINNNFIIKRITHNNMTEPEQYEGTEILNFSEIRDSEYIRLYQPSIRLSYGFKINIDNHLTFILEPTISSMLLPINKNTDNNIVIRYFNAGINIILKYDVEKTRID